MFHLRKILIFVLVLVSAGELTGQWLTGYVYREKIEISGDNVYGTADLAHYPLLVSLIDPDLKSVGFGGLVNSENGWDIRFTADDATSLLDHEAELYTDSTGQLIAWVRIPVLNNDEETEIYMYFGNRDVATDPSTTDTWNNSYHGVWHLGRSAADASQYSNDGTVNEALPAIGKIGYAYAFDGIDDNITINNSPSLNITGDISLQAWGRVTDPNDTAWILTGKSQDYWIWYDWNRLIFFAGDVHLPYTVDLNPNEWYHFAGTHDGSTTRLYLDGIEVASVANSNPTSNDSSDVLTMGIYPANPDPWNYTGEIDELRLLSVPLSGDWIRTSYSNQHDPSQFITALSVETANDEPCNAILLAVDSTCSQDTFNTEYATDSGIPLTECGGYMGNDVWFKLVVPPAGNVLVKIETDAVDQFPNNEGWAYRPGLAVYTGNCDSLTHDTCWISPTEESPTSPEMLLADHTPGDTLFLRVWEHSNNDNGKFRICTRIPVIEIVSVSGSGSYCTEGSGLTIQLDSSQVGVIYQLSRNGIVLGLPLTGTGGALQWPGQAEGVYEVVASIGSSGETERMNGRAIVMEDPLPVVTFGYGYDKLITIDSGKVSGVEELTNFPLLVSIPGDNDLRTTDNGGYVQNSNGYDIIFTDEYYNPIPFERINYIPESGAYSAWVNVPSMFFDSDTRIHILYGNPGVSTDHSSHATWPSSYIQVMHLDGDFADATPTGNFGVNDGTSDTNGKLGAGRRFDGVDDKIIVYDHPSLDGTNDEATFSLWINFADAADGDHQLVMSTENRFSGGGYEWASQGSGNHFFYPNGYTHDNYNLGPNPFTDSVWHYLAVTMDYSTREVDIYVDGESMVFSTENIPTWWTFLAELDNWLWGGNPDRSSRYFFGTMDEIRVQSIARTGDWLMTEYMNQNDPSGFYTVSEGLIYETLAAVCLDAAPFVLNQPRPPGGNFSGTGVSDGSFDPGAAGAGGHTITYQYTDGNGCVSSGSRIQRVLGLPAPVIGGNDLLCPNTSGETYSTPEVAGHSYQWVITGEGASIVEGQGTNQIMVDWGAVSGTIRVRETIDSSGCEFTTAEFNVTIAGATDPLIYCPGDTVAYLDDQCEFILPDYTTLAWVEGNCGPDPVISQIPVEGTTISGSGTYEIVLEALFGDTITANCSFSLLLQDTIRPTVTSLNDTTIVLEERIYKMFVNMPLPAFKDNCGVQTIVNDFNGGTDASGEYSFGVTTIVYTVTDSSGNYARFTQQVTLTSNPEPEWGLVIPEGFSPNEDGLNDRFEILGLEQYPDNELRVFNVHGNEVYKMAGYDNTWDGTSASNLNKGGILPTGTYYYALYLESVDAVVKGFVYLRRE